MNIKKVNFNKRDWSGVIGSVDFEFENGLILKGFTLRDGDKGPWLAPPSKKISDGKYYNYIAFEGFDLKNEWTKVALEASKQPEKKDDQNDLAF